MKSHAALAARLVGVGVGKIKGSKEYVFMLVLSKYFILTGHHTILFKIVWHFSSLDSDSVRNKMEMVMAYVVIQYAPLPLGYWVPHYHFSWHSDQKPPYIKKYKRLGSPV